MPDIAISLFVSPEVPAGVEFCVTNNGNSEIRFLKWGTPFDDVESDCLAVRLNGLQECTFVGRRFKRIYDAGTSTVLVRPGETVSRLVDISLSWDLPARGRYEISLRSSRIKVIRGAGKTRELSPQWDVRDVETGTAYVVVENPRDTNSGLPRAADFADPSAVLTRADIDRLQAEGQAIPDCPPMFLCVLPSYGKAGECFMARYVGHPAMSSGTDDRGTIKNYADLIKRAMAYILSIQGEWKFANDKTYQKWFGVYTPERAQRVANGLNRALAAITCFNFVFYLDNSSPADVIAWWRASGDPTKLGAIGFCPAYFRLSEGGVNSRMGSIGHELTHAFAGTKDHAYGTDTCMQLAKDQPELAIDNADSYEYFMEEKIGLQPF